MTHLERQLRLLAQAGVDFIVIGGMAAAAHGSVRATLDLDVVYSRDLGDFDFLGEVVDGD
jgi:hypothetical protein